MKKSNIITGLIVISACVLMANTGYADDFTTKTNSVTSEVMNWLVAIGGGIMGVSLCGGFIAGMFNKQVDWRSVAIIALCGILISCVGGIVKLFF